MKDKLEPTRIEIELAQSIWDYGNLRENMKEADFILGMGSIDLLPAYKAAELYIQRFAPVLLFSGKGGRNSEKSPRWRNGLTEARMMAEAASERGIKMEDIVLEENATNSAENIRFSRTLLESLGIKAKVGIFPHMPYALRRDKATITKHWPGIEVLMASPDVPLEEYHLTGYQGTMTRRDLISDMLGDFQRTFIYAHAPRAFLMPQTEIVPESVVNAYYELVERGFTESLVKQEGKVEDIALFLPK